MKKSIILAFSIGLLMIGSCTKTSGYLGEPDPFLINPIYGNIPFDANAQNNPTVSSTNSIIPNLLFYTKQGYDNIVFVDLTGINDPNTQAWLKLFGTNQSNQNIWIEVDNTPKGILVVNNAGTGNSVKADIVFLVDNSGSMNEEADSVANDIIKWSSKLAQKGLDLRFGCVGYSEDGSVNGGIDLTTQTNMSQFLNRSGVSGIGRTVGFSGISSTILQNSATTSYKNCTAECGVQALRFADKLFSFRTGANRLYVNFTDEPNQPNGKIDWSVDFLKDQSNWNTAQGTIHTVFSADSTTFKTGSQMWSPLQQERPWLMSKYTGGTILFAPPTFSGVNLDNLPVTGAMSNSYTISFLNTSIIPNGKHTVKITIISNNGLVTAEKTFYQVKFGN